MDTLAVRRIKVLDGLFYSFRLLEHHYENLYPACNKVRESPDTAVAILAGCWGFIDMLHRARELAQLVPGLGRRNAELSLFLRTTGLAEEYRHYMQHLRRELGNTEAHGFPVWGSISWVDPQDESLSHTVMIGSLPPDTKTNFSGAVFDSLKKKWVSRVSLGIRGSSFNFDPMLEAAKRFEAYVIPWILDRAGIATLPKGQLPIVTARFVVGEVPPNQGEPVTAAGTER